MKKGDLVTIDFRAAGVTSYEEYPIWLVEPNHITIDYSQNDENGRLRFSRRTGICLNEDDEMKGMFRSKRELNEKHRFPPKVKDKYANYTTLSEKIKILGHINQHIDSEEYKSGKLK